MPTDDGDQPPTYRILDAQGRPIGRVRLAVDGLPLGRGAGTVLLIRECRTGLRPTRCGAPLRLPQLIRRPLLHLHNT
jgi:hypothetical protein